MKIYVIYSSEFAKYGNNKFAEKIKELKKPNQRLNNKISKTKFAEKIIQKNLKNLQKNWKMKYRNMWSCKIRTHIQIQ